MNTTRIRTGEKEARQILLARAIEIVDVQGRLISDAERDELDVRAGEVARSPRGQRLDVGSALRSRAAEVLGVVGRRNPAIAALHEIPPWRSMLITGLPLLAFVLGFSSDFVANPHRLDLVSLPLLAVVLWNLVFYLLLVVRIFVKAEPFESRLRQLAAPFTGVRRFSRHTRAEVAANFVATWQSVAARLNASRLTLALHLSAAAWAAGAALSLFVRGVAYQYRVGWESTWLSAQGVQSLLSVVFWPATTLLNLTPFTLQEITAMRFDADAPGSVESARSWVLLYAATLAIVVIIPRLVLAFSTWLHERALAARLTIELDEPYFQRLIDRLVPSQVRLSLRTHREADRISIDRVLQQGGEAGSDDVLLSTPIGDTLRMTEISAPPTLPVATPLRWWERAWAWALGDEKEPGRLEDGTPGAVLLHVIGDPADLEETITSSDQQRPAVLLLVNAPSADAESALLDKCQSHQKHHMSVADVLSFESFARCWVQEPRLLDAIATCAPPSQSQGARRIAAAWSKRNVARFQKAMALLAEGLLRAARETEKVRSPPLSFRNLISKEHRDSRADAKRMAMAEVVERLKHAESATMSGLLELHRLPDTALEEIEHGLEVNVDTQASVDAPQAGLAGAASGAAVGASVDLATGGLTLGVAALLGALVGGSAAFVSASWNNRKSPNGATTIQLSDEMLLALVEASLLRYIAVIHARSKSASAKSAATRQSWHSEVLAAVKVHRAQLTPLWAAARSEHPSGEASARLASVLETIATKVLRNLYPAARIGVGARAPSPDPADTRGAAPS